jgi:hypothetical protein
MPRSRVAKDLAHDVRLVESNSAAAGLRVVAAVGARATRCHHDAVSSNGTSVRQDAMGSYRFSLKNPFLKTNGRFEHVCAIAMYSCWMQTVHAMQSCFCSSNWHRNYYCPRQYVCICSQLQQAKALPRQYSSAVLPTAATTT